MACGLCGVEMSVLSDAEGGGRQKHKGPKLILAGEVGKRGT